MHAPLMDPLSQASLGAAVAVALSRPREARMAALVGALAGAAPDLDVLIRSETDSLLALEYHRHFTHALVMVPFIGLTVAALVFALFRRRHAFSRLAVFGIAGALTHGPLDACTSYGTLLYWPLHSHRESWDIISIIDPIFTGPLVVLLLIAVFKNRPQPARLACLLCFAYLIFGTIQRERAQAFARSLALQRGHQTDELTARPSIANLFLWRTIYRDGDDYFVDAVQLGLAGQRRHYRGARVPAFTDEDAESLAPEGSVLASDIARFRFFSQGYLYRHPGEAEVLGDLRYAVFPDSIIPLWGIRFDPREPDAHVALEYFREVSEGDFARLWTMVRGRPLPD